MEFIPEKLDPVELDLVELDPVNLDLVDPDPKKLNPV